MANYKNQYDAICDFENKLKSAYFTNELDVIGPSTAKQNDNKSDSGTAYVLTSKPNQVSQLGTIYVEGLRKGVYNLNIRLKSSDVTTSSSLYKITISRLVDGNDIGEAQPISEQTITGTNFSYCGTDEYSNIIVPLKNIGNSDATASKICISIEINSLSSAKTLSFDYCDIQLSGVHLSTPS